MHECLRLYDAALRILAKEVEAFDREDEEHLEELCRERYDLMEEAWNLRAGCDSVLLRGRLEAIRNAQDSLAGRARMTRDNLRLALQSSRKESGRLNAYGKLVTTRQNALILSKEG